MLAESLNSLGGILSYPAASQIRLPETRNAACCNQPHNLRHHPSEFFDKHLRISTTYVYYPSAHSSISRFKKSRQSCLATGHIKGHFPQGELAYWKI